MTQYTATIKQITVDDAFDIFDFDYSRSVAAQAIISNDDLQAGFIQHYLYREVGAETLERFKQFLKREWTETIGSFDKKLVAYATDAAILSNSKMTATATQTNNDTPQSAITQGKTYATSISTTENSNGGYAGQTESELREIYFSHLHNLQKEFYESFENLFMQLF